MAFLSGHRQRFPGRWKTAARLWAALGYLCALTAGPPAVAAGQRSPVGRPTRTDSAGAWERAVAARQVFEEESTGKRTRAAYAGVMDGFRAIYHGEPGSVYAPRAVDAVAELLAEEGRELKDRKSLRDAAGQYEFLAKAYPGSSLAAPGLGKALALLGPDAAEDAAEAGRVRALLVRGYPQSAAARGAGAVEIVGAAPDSLGGAEGRRFPSGTTTKEAVPQLVDSQRRVPGAAPAMVTGIRHWSTATYTRVAIDLGGEVEFQAARVEGPDRIFFDLHGAKLAPGLVGKSFAITDDGFLKTIRAGQAGTDVTRIVLDVQPVAEYSAFLLPNPTRLIIDVHGKAAGQGAEGTRGHEQPRPGQEEHPTLSDGAGRDGAPGLNASPTRGQEEHPTLSDGAGKNGAPGLNASPTRGREHPTLSDGAGKNGAPGLNASPTRGREHPTLSDGAGKNGAPGLNASPTRGREHPTLSDGAGRDGAPGVGSERAAAPVVRVDPGALKSTGDQASSLPPMPVTDGSAEFGLPPKRASAGGPASDKTAWPRVVVSALPTVARPVPNSVSSAVPVANREVATMSEGPGVIAATAKPTSRPVVDRGREQGSGLRAQGSGSREQGSGERRSAEEPGPGVPAVAAGPTAEGQSTLMRALGLKIGRIVVDAGHGGHDSGTLGADGIMEKDVVLDVALRLGKLLHDRLGAEVVYTRADDTFVPLETRTAIANKAQADLFISVHANSSADPSARGVEVYYLNFTSDPEAMAVAGRENAVSSGRVNQLSDLVKKIALKDKIDESRELAADVDQSLYSGLKRGNGGLRDRGVKKAPFVVLIGANMPSILAEISFVTNPEDADKLSRPEYRERVAESLYGGVARYAVGINGVPGSGKGRPWRTERAALKGAAGDSE